MSKALEAQVVEVKLHEMIAEKFWQKDFNEIVPLATIGNWIKEARVKTDHPKAGQPVLKKDVDAIISKVRFCLEEDYKTTLWNRRGVGYKLADPHEVAVYAIKTGKRIAIMCDRAERLGSIVDHRCIPGAMKEVYESYSKGMSRLSKNGKKYVEKVLGWDKEEKKKLIEAQKEG